MLIGCSAANAQRCGLFTDEIVPVSTKLVDKDGNESQVVVRIISVQLMLLLLPQKISK